MTLPSKYLIFADVESTGFCPMKNDVTSIGAVITDRSHNLLREFYTTVRPDINKFTSDDALKVSGFSREQLMEHKPRREALIAFSYFLKPYLEIFPQTLISHTVNSFDYRFIDWCFRKEGFHFSLYRIIRYDFQESTIKMGRDAGFSTNKLSEWAERLSLTFQHHNALDDAKMCLNVHKYLSELKS